MKKSIKLMLASILAVPMLALGLCAFAPSASVFAVCDETGGTAGGASGGADCAQGEGQPANLFGNGGIFQTIVDTILYVLGAVSVIMLVYGGVRYTISAGDSAHVTAAKNTIMYAIIGLIVALLAYAIVHFVLTSLIGTPTA